MQRHRIVIAAIVNLSLCLAAFGQVERPGGRVRTMPPIVAQPANGNVVIYAQRNFSGQSMVLAPGDNRLTDLKPASIRVPPGLVAYLYEYVDSAGGYAGFTLFPADASVLTVEYKLNLVAPATGERLVAEASVVKPGRTLVITRGEVYAERAGARTLCAIMQQTLIVLAGKPDY